MRHDYHVHGEVCRFLPMMAVRQEKGHWSKVRPVFDYRSLNDTVESIQVARHHCVPHICVNGDRLARIVLFRTYTRPTCRYTWIQCSGCIRPSVGPRGEVYLLTLLGFGQTIMTAIVEWIMSADPDIHKAASNYIDDILIRKDVVSIEQVRGHFWAWGLETKKAEHLGSTAVRVLGLSISPELCWSPDKQLPGVNGEPLTGRQLHRILGEWVGHLPVVSWLQVACGFLQCCTSLEGTEWDAPTMRKVQDAAELIKISGDPAKGKWLVDPEAPINVWVDASSLAVGVMLEVGGHVIEDAAWLRPSDDSAHINLG